MSLFKARHSLSQVDPFFIQGMPDTVQGKADSSQVKPFLEVLNHECQPIAEHHFWFPTKCLVDLGDVWPAR